MAHNHLFMLCFDAGSQLERFEALYVHTVQQMLHEGAFTAQQLPWLDACHQIARHAAWVCCALQQCTHALRGWTLEPKDVQMLIQDTPTLIRALSTLTDCMAHEHPSARYLVEDFQQMPSAVCTPICSALTQILARCQAQPDPLHPKQ